MVPIKELGLAQMDGGNVLMLRLYEGWRQRCSKSCIQCASQPLCVCLYGKLVQRSTVFHIAIGKHIVDVDTAPRAVAHGTEGMQDGNTLKATVCPKRTLKRIKITGSL